MDVEEQNYFREGLSAFDDPVFKILKMVDDENGSSPFFPLIFTSHPLINFPPFFLIPTLSSFSKMDGLDYPLISIVFYN
ncbi:hypothetical protein QL285_083481 [Trifolium repens]|nr:hypothetical protein QL285_083481 [Trifolium repens]